MRRPAGWHYASEPPGGVRATPPFRHYERNLRTQQCETDEHRPFATLEGIAKAGLEPKNRRGGAPRGGASPARGRRELSARDARRESACGPRLVRRTGAAAPERLSALRSLFAEEGNMQ